MFYDFTEDPGALETTSSFCDSEDILRFGWSDPNDLLDLLDVLDTETQESVMVDQN